MEIMRFLDKPPYQPIPSGYYRSFVSFDNGLDNAGENRNVDLGTPETQQAALAAQSDSGKQESKNSEE